MFQRPLNDFARQLVNRHSCCIGRQIAESFHIVSFESLKSAAAVYTGRFPRLRRCCAPSSWCHDLRVVQKRRMAAKRLLCSGRGLATPPGGMWAR
jgi:hypothetical protein